MKRQRLLLPGYTLVELIVIMSILATLFGLVTINLNYAQRKATIETVLTSLLTDIKQQQLKAMVGDTEGRGTTDYYGVYFEANRYTLFHGSTYNPNDAANFTVNIDQNLQVQNIGKTIVFNKLGGDVVGYSSSANTITILDTSNNSSRTITYNQLGVITASN